MREVYYKTKHQPRAGATPTAAARSRRLGSSARQPAAAPPAPAAEILQQSPDVKQQTEQHEPIQEPVQRLQHTSQQEQVQVQKQVQQVQQELSRARAARAACRGTPAKRPEVALRGSGYCSGS